MSATVRVGISTCPNDTFLFHAILERRVDLRGLSFEVELADVEELNRRLFAGELDVAKASFHAGLLLSRELGVLPTGSALGFGVGPVLLARAGGPLPDVATATVLCPGEHTTAHLLYRLFHGGRARQAVFSEVLDALAEGRAELGVCIHEGRFTFRERGLRLVEDLGERWERETGVALPLGGLLARHALGPERLRAVQAVLCDSLAYARSHRAEALATMRRHAQEHSDDVLWAHVELYVNERTTDLGRPGRRALAELARRARAAGLVPEGQPALRVVGDWRLYHLAPREDWAAFLARGGEWRPPSLDTAGFVHLSFAEQLEGTLELHFGRSTELELVEVAEPGVRADLALEPARGGARFPHLRRALRVADVVRTWPVVRRGGAWRLPDLDD